MILMCITINKPELNHEMQGWGGVIMKCSLSVSLRMCVCVSVSPLFDMTIGPRPNLARTCGLSLELFKSKKVYPPHPGGFRGSQIQKSGKCHELARKSIKKLTPTRPSHPGVGSNSNLKKIDSPHPGGTHPTQGGFRGSKIQKSGKFHELSTNR